MKTMILRATFNQSETVMRIDSLELIGGIVIIRLRHIIMYIT